MKIKLKNYRNPDLFYHIDQWDQVRNIISETIKANYCEIYINEKTSRVKFINHLLVYFCPIAISGMKIINKLMKSIDVYFIIDQTVPDKQMRIEIK